MQKMKVWESPFIPSQLTFKSFKFHSLSFNQSHNNHANNENYLFIITFQNLEFWDVTQPNTMSYVRLMQCGQPNPGQKWVSHATRGMQATKLCASGFFGMHPLKPTQ